MNLQGIAKNTKWEKLVKAYEQAESNGSTTYWTLAFIAKQKGYDDLYEAICKNAMEDAVHGGMYATFLGNGPQSEEELWQVLRKFYQAEAGADKQLHAQADKIEADDDPNAKTIAKYMRKTIPQENMHAKRLADVFKNHDITLK